MIDVVAGAGAWLLQRAATLPDTIYTRTVASASTPFERATAVASGLMTLIALAFAIAAIPAAWAVWRSFRRVQQLLDRVYADVNPIMRHASSIVDNVDFVTTSLRADVQQLNAAVAMANQRLQQAMATTEERIGEFNALLDVVQDEAEQAFVSTAAAVRGVRGGASALTGGRRRPPPPIRRPGPNLATGAVVDLDDAEALDASPPAHGGGSEDEFEDEDIEHGDDGYTEAAEDGIARPRVRPRRDRGWT